MHFSAEVSVPVTCRGQGHGSPLRLALIDTSKLTALAEKRAFLNGSAPLARRRGNGRQPHVKPAFRRCSGPSSRRSRSERVASIRAASFSRAAAIAASISGRCLNESGRCLGRPSVRSSTSLTARRATRSSSEPIKRLSRTRARSSSSGSVADKSSSSATSTCFLSSLRLRIFSARAWRDPHA
jgi:hypothetical protein